MTGTNTDLAIVILAAGQGTRMKSSLPKVLHRVAGQSMLDWVQSTALALSPARLVTVLGPETRDLERAGDTVVQEDRRGTGHAVQIAKPALDGFSGWILVMYGDTALVQSSTLQAMVDQGTQAGAVLVVTGFRPADPERYGRLVVSGERLDQIVEFKDASPAEREIDLCNGGIMALRAPLCLDLLDQLSDDNAAGELYLTDLVALLNAAGGTCIVTDCDEVDVKGVNTQRELAEVEALMQARLRTRLMAGGVTMQDPASVFLSYDTEIEPQTVLEPNQIMGPGVRIGAGVTVKGFCHLEGAEVGEGAIIGPYARLRPGTRLAAHVRIGNFVETKSASLDEGAKVNHLSYIGDASVCAKANVGAGTITCNYDGFSKHKTEIGAGVFIGSNSALVAPIKIGDGAIVGAGSTLSKDVNADELAVARGRVSAIPGGAAQLRKKLSKA